jgi:hypothetical protein
MKTWTATKVFINEQNIHGASFSSQQIISGKTDFIMKSFLQGFQKVFQKQALL